MGWAQYVWQLLWDTAGMSERTGSRTAQLEQSPTYKDHKDHLVNSNLRRTAYYKRLWLLLSMSTM